MTMQPLETEQPLFREAALRAKYDAPTVQPLPGLGAPHWGLLGVLASAGLALIGAACFGRVELTSTAHGALVVSQGPRAVVAEVPGRLASLAVAAGSRVEAGQELGRIEATELSARSRSAERKLDMARASARRARVGSLERRRDMLEGLRKKRAVVVQRLALKRSVLEQRAGREARVAALAKDHLTSALDREAVAIETQNAREEVLLSRQQIADIDIEIAQHRLELEAEEHALEKDELDAEVELGEAQALSALGSVRAPESGWVESLLVSPGQIVSSGATLARVVPDGALTTAVVFVSADDAAFLRPGLEARIEFPSLPPSEFGGVRASVTRVSNDVALAPEVAEVLGERAPREALVRVELSLVSDSDLARLALHLRSGARVTARLTTREVPVVVLLFEVARRWYDA